MEPLLLLLAALLLLALIYWYGTRNFGSLERLGVPVIRPYPFVGSFPRPWKVICVTDDLQHARTYGKLWGQYEGPWPQLFVADVDMAKQIMIKDFDHFPDRPQLFDFQYGRDQLDMLPAESWKPLRSLLTPVMTTSGKLKAMVPTMRDCLEDAGRRLDAQLERDGPAIDAQRDLFGPLTLDVMAQFSFGMRVPDVADKESVFVRHGSAFSVPADPPQPLVSLAITAFPALGHYLASKALVPAFRYFIEVLRRSIKQRRAEGVQRADLVGTIMDALDNKVPTAEYRRLGLTEEVVLIQGAEMLIAAYDTVGTALNKSAYFLATEPAAAEEVAREAQELDELTYESVTHLPKLEAFVKEVLRLAPLLVRHFRVCTRDWQHEGGLRIPRGTTVFIPMSVFHMDETLFPEPERFRPERWLEEDAHRRLQYAWMPFGLGPRTCIGSRLAMVECKFFLAWLLRRYRFTACSQTRFEYVPGSMLFAATQPVIVNVEKI